MSKGDFFIVTKKGSEGVHRLVKKLSKPERKHVPIRHNIKTVSLNRKK